MKHIFKFTILMALAFGTLNAHAQAVYQYAYVVTDSGSENQLYVKQTTIANTSQVTYFRFQKNQINVTVNSYGAVNIFTNINSNQTPQLTINAYPNGDSILITDQYGTHNFSGNKSGPFSAYLSAISQQGTYLFKYIINNTLTQVKTGTGVLHSIVIDSAAAAGGAGGKLLVIDGTDTFSATPRIGVPRTTAVGAINYDIKFHKGLLIKEEGTAEITVTYYFIDPEMWDEDYEAMRQ